MRPLIVVATAALLLTACGDTIVVIDSPEGEELDMTSARDEGASPPLDMGQPDLRPDAQDMATARDMTPPAQDMAPAPEDMGGEEPVDMSPPAEDMGEPPEDEQFVGGACSVAGQAGTCQRTWECDAPNTSTPGYCPGPSHIQCCTPPPAANNSTAGDCDPDASPRPNTSWQEAAGDAGCPDGMARVDTFCVDRHEASLVQVLANGSEQSWSPYRNPGQARVRAVSVAGAVPQGYINADQAAAACAEAGKRLCSNTEWLRACQSAAGWTYPYGPTEQPGVCNDARAQHPVIEYFGTSADWIWSELGNACINQLPDSVARTGDHPGCETAEGVFDMMGNLHEWTSDPSGTFRGGFYVDTYRNGPGCLYRTTAHNRQHWDYSTGFRCCADASP